MSMHKNVITLCCAAAFALGLAACSSSDDPPPPAPPPVDPGPSAYEAGKAAIMAAMTEADAQAAYDAINLSMVSGDEAEGLRAALDMRLADLATMDREAMQKTALMNAAGMIDTSDLTTQANVDAANAAIAALEAALAAATDVSDADKAMYQTMVDSAEGAVMVAQTTIDRESQMTAIASAVAALDAIDLDDLMTQAQIDAAEAAIIALDLALTAAVDLSDADKLDATVDVTLAKRKVESAKTTLADNIDGQRMALNTAGTALSAIDLDDLDTPAKIDAAKEALAALEMALNDATHLSDSEKDMYQTQLGTAKETVRVAETGMALDDRMMTQRSAIINAVTMARTAVAGVNDDSTDSEVASADAAIAALKMAIEEAEDLPEGDSDIAMAQGTLDTLEPQLAAAKSSRMAAIEEREEEQGKAMAAVGKALRAALGPPDADDTTALDNIDDTSALLSADGKEFGVVAAIGAGALTNTAVLPAVTLEAGDSAGSLGGWMGTDYAHSAGTGTSKVSNAARVYNNKGPGRTQPFTGTGGKYILVSGQTGAAADNNGYLGSDATTILDVSVAPEDLAKVMSTTFEHSATQNHAVPERGDAFYAEGTYDGAPGEFRCETGCSSTNDGSGAPSALGGVWHFKPYAGAMVNTPDAHYLYYGWWVSKDDEDMPTAASVFTGRVGTDAAVTDGLDNAWTGAYTAGTTLTGSATYTGNAAGKFAISNPLDGTGNGGHFTADATLDATFSADDTDDVGITVTIDNFRLNDGTEDAGWSVSLHQAGFGSDGAISAPTDVAATTGVDESMGTTWSIGDNSTAGRSGTWSGQLYDEKPGDPSATGPGDGSTIPTTVTGTFYSEFSTIGRMVGAFGADN